MAIHTFAPMQYDSHVMAKQLVSELLFIHITMAILSYGAFSLSFVFSTLYLIQYDLLKKKKWGTRLVRIRRFSKLEKLSYILDVIGVPMLLLSLILRHSMGLFKGSGYAVVRYESYRFVSNSFAYSIIFVSKNRERTYLERQLPFGIQLHF